MTTQLTPQKAAAKRLMERDFERLRLKYDQCITTATQEIPEEVSELQQLWRLGGFGEPPAFRASMQLVMAG